MFWFFLQIFSYDEGGVAARVEGSTLKIDKKCKKRGERGEML